MILDRLKNNGAIPKEYKLKLYKIPVTENYNLFVQDKKRKRNK
jgi:hypothetical protein